MEKKGMWKKERKKERKKKERIHVETNWRKGKMKVTT